MVKQSMVISLLIVGCGEKLDMRGRKGENAKPCTVATVAGGALISCPDGSESYIANGTEGQAGANGNDGSDGTNGKDGIDGVICSVEEVDEGAKITCGDKSVIVQNGSDGKDGTDGEDGEAGADANPCKVDPVPNGIRVTCGSSIAYVLNGQKGTDGTDGKDGTDGAAGQDGTDGTDGKDGEDGSDGVNGTNGSSCSVVRYKDSAKITCTDGTETIIEFPTIKVITVPVDKDKKEGKKDD